MTSSATAIDQMATRGRIGFASAALCIVFAFLLLALLGCTPSQSNATETLSVGRVSVQYPDGLSVKQGPAKANAQIGGVEVDSQYAVLGSDDDMVSIAVFEYDGIGIQGVYDWERARFEKGSASEEELDAVIEGTGGIFANATIREPQMIEIGGREGVSAGFGLSNGVKVVNRYVSIDGRSVACVGAVMTDELYKERGELFDTVFNSIEIS